jgi:tryptophan synthase alpha chain
LVHPSSFFLLSASPLIIAVIMVRSISQTFDQLRKQHKIGLVPFVPAGYPDLNTTAATLAALDAAGSSAIEVGFPFSDPIADGPTIQAAFTAALANKIKVSQILATVKSVRPRIDAPLIAMISYSIVFRYGLAKFLADVRASGFDGLILPDLPPPEAGKICQLVRAAGLDTILLIAPTTAPQRRAEIVKLCSGFVYYLSVSGITGERDKLPDGLADQVNQLKSLTRLPVCVGFGIHRREQVTDLAKIADGAIVGSAIVSRMKQRLADGPEAIAAAVGAYARELLGVAN